MRRSLKFAAVALGIAAFAAPALAQFGPPPPPTPQKGPARVWNDQVWVNDKPILSADLGNGDTGAFTGILDQKGGKVRLNDARPKTGAIVRVGDLVRVRLGPIERTLAVTGLADRRGTAAAAAALYEETAESRARRVQREAQLKLMPETSFRGKGRPTKRERRKIERLRDPWPE